MEEKKKFVVDVYRTLVQTIEVEADSKEEADKKAFDMGVDKLTWTVGMMNDDVETVVSGEVDKNGERQYY